MRSVGQAVSRRGAGRALPSRSSYAARSHAAHAGAGREGMGKRRRRLHHAIASRAPQSSRMGASSDAVWRQLSGTRMASHLAAGKEQLEENGAVVAEHGEAITRAQPVIFEDARPLLGAPIEFGKADLGLGLALMKGQRIRARAPRALSGKIEDGSHSGRDRQVLSHSR